MYWYVHVFALIFAFYLLRYTIQYTVGENDIGYSKFFIFQYCNIVFFSIATCQVIAPVLIRFIFNISSLLLLLMSYYSYRSINYCNSNSNSCRSFLLLKTHRFLLLDQERLKSDNYQEKNQRISIKRILRAFTLNRAIEKSRILKILLKKFAF